jgi:hypothetical protein
VLKANSTISLSTKTPLGVLELALSDEEIYMLQLIADTNHNELECWKNVWEKVSDYEDLPFSCKELMPSAIKKLQDNTDQKSWQNIAAKNAIFLIGLPRYTWTKNHYIINQYKIIASALEAEKIEIIAIKGVGEMLANSSLSMTRTSRDIDVLIRPEDWEKCQNIFTKLGWNIAIKKHELGFLNNPLESHAETFNNKEGIIDLDVHFSAIGGPKSTSEEFTKKLWQRKVRSKTYPNFFIPSAEDRLIIAAANAYKIHTWKTGQTCKYLYDGLSISNGMSAEEIKNACTHGEKYLELGKSMTQLIKVLHHIKSPNTIEIKGEDVRQKRRMVFDVNSSFVSKLIYLIHFKNLSKLLFSGSQTLHVFYFIGSRAMNFILIRIPKKIRRFFFRSKPKGTVSTSPAVQFKWYFLAKN